MSRPEALAPFYDGWADHQRKLVDTLRPLTPEQAQLRPAPGEWAIWQLASNIAGGRLYWLCVMLGQDGGSALALFRTPEGATTGWEDDLSRPRRPEELVDALEQTWAVVERCLDRWSLDDLRVPVTTTDAWGRTRSVTPGWALWRLMSHDVHHGSEIALILRMHGQPTAISI